MRFLVLTIVTLFSAQIRAQSIVDLFKEFDFGIDYPMKLTKNIKDSLLKNGSYIVPGGDDEITERLSLNLDSNQIELSSDFTTGQSGFYTISLHKFVRNNGTVLVGYSKYGGGQRIYDHHDLKFYNYSESVFSIDATIDLPNEILIEGFLKSGVSDSLAKVIESNVNTHIAFGVDEVNDVQYLLFEGAPGYSHYINSHAVKYLWNGEVFEQMKDRGSNCSCPESNIIAENRYPCDTTIFDNGAKLYWQWNCDSSWLVFENKQKKVLRSCHETTPYECQRTRLNFVKEFSSHLLFIHKWVSGCCALPDMVLISKENGEEVKRISKDLMVVFDYDNDYSLYFTDTTFSSLVLLNHRNDVSSSAKFKKNKIFNSIASNGVSQLTDLFQKIKVVDDKVQFDFLTEDRLLEPMVISFK